MASSFQTFHEPRKTCAPPELAELDATRTGADKSNIVLSPREAAQTQVNRLAFLGLAVVGLLVIAAMTVVF